MRQDILHYYREARQHQLSTYGPNGLQIDGVDQHQFTGGGAAYGHHASAAYFFARRQDSFCKSLADNIEAAAGQHASAAYWRARRQPAQ